MQTVTLNREQRRAGKTLADFPQFILWKLIRKPGRPKPDKVPVHYVTRQVCDAQDKTAWFEADVAEYITDAEHKLGFALTKETSVWCIDIDSCLLPDGAWSPLALEVVNSLPGAIVEVSHSGKGLHIFGTASSIPEHTCKNTDLGIELYSENRFIALGDIATMKKPMADCTAALASIISRYFPSVATTQTPAEWTTAPRSTFNQGKPIDDKELIERACASTSSGAIFGDKASFCDLWFNNVETLAANYPSSTGDVFDRSSADFALVNKLHFFTGGDCERTERLMRISGLRREKYERENYLKTTILKAFAGKEQAPVYNEAPPAPPVTVGDDLHGKFYYLKYGEKFLMHNERGWMTIPERSLRNVLAGRGFNTAKGKNLISVADQEINKIRENNDVDYAAPLAGHREGLYVINDARVLVTKDPTIIEPKAGDYSLLDRLIRGLLEIDPPQTDYFYSWLKIAFEALYSGNFRPGQAVAFVGPKDCGKSLIQSIITQVVGGKESDPYQFMMGLTQFNSHLFQAVHIRVDDASGSTDIKARRNFGSQIKQIAAKDIHNCHGKGREALSLNPLWRLTISLNDGLENILVLPPIDEDIEDKLMIFQAKRSPVIPANDNQRKQFWSALISQLPAFVAMLCKYEIPDSIRYGRFGVKCYYNAGILGNLRKLQPEERLRELVDQYLFNPNETEWTGTADDLQTRLSCANGVAANNLFGNWPPRCGVLLSRLSVLYSKRFMRDGRKSDDSVTPGLR